MVDAFDGRREKEMGELWDRLEELAGRLNDMGYRAEAAYLRGFIDGLTNADEDPPMGDTRKDYLAGIDALRKMASKRKTLNWKD